MAALLISTACKRTWKVFGSTELAVVLLLLLVGDLVGGFFALQFGANPFRPLNDLGLAEWMRTYGWTHLGRTLWFHLLLGLLFVLALNTFVCTTTRVHGLLKSRASFASRSRLVLKFAPHIMHYALILILLGTLASYLFAHTTPNNLLAPGTSLPIPSGSYTVELETLQVDYYEGKRLPYWQNRAMDANATISFRAGDGTVVRKAVLAVNRPVWFEGFSIHLKDFGPHSRGSSMSRRPYVNLIIKEDPGIRFYFAGTLLFAAGLVMYLYDWMVVRLRKEEKR